VNRIIGLKFHFLFLVVLLVQSSCIKKTISLPPDQRPLAAKNATRAELLQALQERSSQIKTLQTATVLLDLKQGTGKSGVVDQYRQTSGIIIVERPSQIRIQVQAPLVLTTVATMVSDGKKYRLSIPYPTNKFGEADVDAPVKPTSSISNLRPQVFLEGLFVDIRPYQNKPNVRFGTEEQTQGIHSYYVFNVNDTTTDAPFEDVLEKIWIDRLDLQVTRKQVFGKNGALQTDVQYSNYQDVGGIPFPQEIVIQRPGESLEVKMTFQPDKLKLNETVDPSAWELTRPEDAETLDLTPR
jgi:outer membrane lipoprotein-sorting protein